MAEPSCIAQADGGALCTMAGGAVPAHLWSQIVRSLGPWLVYVNALPSSVEAVVYPDYANADDIAFAKELHRRFLGAFDLTKAQVPLLRYTTSRRAAPAFTIVDE